MTIDVRIARALALGSWAVFFGAVALSGETARYLGERTAWVVPFGAVITGATAILLLSRGRSGTPLGRREALGMLALLAPIFVVLAFPQAELGAAAAERRSTSPGAAARLAKPPSPISGISYAHIMAAQGPVPQPGVVPGVRVRLLGFAMRRQGTAPGLFQVARFQINCCIADAMVLYVTVDPPAATPAEDTWIVVTGPLAKRDGELIVKAETVRTISPPKRPYLRGGVPAEVVPVRHGTKPPNPTAP
jgi:uncharacterized repeat protein (TIGR03943 family)